jgi:hypothetical protein
MITVGNDRLTLLAAAVMAHGEVVAMVCGLGPSLPPAYTTVIPF